MFIAEVHQGLFPGLSYCDLTDRLVPEYADDYYICVFEKGFQAFPTHSPPLSFELQHNSQVHRRPQTTLARYATISRVLKYVT